VDGGPRSATVSTLEPIEALVITATDFNRFMAANEGVALAILCIVAGRLRDADRQRLEFASYDTIGRIGRRLVDLASEYGVEGALGSRSTFTCRRRSWPAGRGHRGRQPRRLSRSLVTIRWLLPAA
jgi:CRP/FNR family transcriptional regulator, cyclic AMP receptor protein